MVGRWSHWRLASEKTLAEPRLSIPGPRYGASSAGLCVYISSIPYGARPTRAEKLLIALPEEKARLAGSTTLLRCAQLWSLENLLLPILLNLAPRIATQVVLLTHAMSHL